MKKFKNILSALLLLITLVLVVFLIVTRVQGKTPEIFGYQILRVSSASMSPRLEVGDVILSKRVDDVASLELGDVITYKGTEGSYKDKLITHEVVVEPLLEADGKYYLQTMGIANNAPDPVICEEQVVGELVCTIPFLSAVYNFFKTPWGLVVILGFLAVLFINESVTLVRLVKSKNESTYDEVEDVSVDKIEDDHDDAGFVPVDINDVD